MAQHSQLLALPGELRNRIYEYTLPDVSTVFISRAGFVQPPPLAQVCYQIREELSGYLRALPWAETRTIMAKVINCDFRHGIEICEALTEADIERIECLKLNISLSEDGPLDRQLLAQGADTLFVARCPHLHPLPAYRFGDGVEVHSSRDMVAVIGNEKKAIRHELVVDIIHTEQDYRECTCSRLVREETLFQGTLIDDGGYRFGGPHFIPSPRTILEEELENAFRQNHSSHVKQRLEAQVAIAKSSRQQREETARRMFEKGFREEAARRALRVSIGEVLSRTGQLDRAMRRNLRAMSREKEAVILHWFRRFSEKRKEGKDVSVLRALFKAPDEAESVPAAQDP